MSGVDMRASSVLVPLVLMDECLFCLISKPGQIGNNSESIHNLDMIAFMIDTEKLTSVLYTHLFCIITPGFDLIK